MKVNGKPIFRVITHKEIIVEKTVKGLTFPESVPVYHEFNYDNLIGIATLKRGTIERNCIYADIRLLADIKGFPAIAFADDKRIIYALSIGSVPNKDPEIKPIL